MVFRRQIALVDLDFLLLHQPRRDRVAFSNVSAVPQRLQKLRSTLSEDLNLVGVPQVNEKFALLKLTQVTKGAPQTRRHILQ
jgi:hypothetical protein